MVESIWAIKEVTDVMARLCSHYARNLSHDFRKIVTFYAIFQMELFLTTNPAELFGEGKIV